MPGLSLVTGAPSTARALGPEHPAQAVFDRLTETARIRPRLLASEATSWLADVAIAIAGLARGDRARATVRVASEPEPWELAFERSGGDLLITLFQGGPIPEIALHERRLDGDAARAAVLAGIDATDDEIAFARGELEASPFDDAGPASEPIAVAVEPSGDLSMVISAEVLLRSSHAATASGSVHRADLASLLFRGKLRLTLGGASRELNNVLVFLVAEQLAGVALDALDAFSRGRPSYRRLTVGGAICGVRLASDGAASLTLGVPRRDGDLRGQPWTFPAVEINALIRAVVAFGRGLARTLLRRDRAQAQNLRLLDFRAKIRELGDRLKDVTRDDSKINQSPESYRAFAARQSAPQSSSSSDFGKTRLRFSARWFAAVPSIDLRATFLCGDRLVVGQGREVSCLDRKGGEILWRRGVPRGVAVMTPLGLARVEPEGALSLYELDRGDVVWSSRLAPRVGGSASGAVVSAPGLPRLLIVSEGTRHLAAVDLHNGEVRWRFAAQKNASFKLRRAGRLVIVASGDATLTAIDVLTGEIVWRLCDRLRFASPVAADHDALFAIAGDGAFVAKGGARLHHLDPWSGVVRWTADLPPYAAATSAPLLGDESVVVPAAGRGGTTLYGFDRASGTLLFERVVTSSAASCLLVDETVIVNSESGELIAVDAKDGSPRYRHVFAGGAEGDRPRRLEPVLRSGALFVPQTEVHVVRPRDGALLGKVPDDIIPDLLRVDERCDVYVVEESGHVAAYAAAPRLSLVGS